VTAPLPFDRIRLFELLKPKLGAEESKAIVDALDSISANIKPEIEAGIGNATGTLSTKEDLAQLKVELREDIHRLEIKMNERLNNMLIWLVASIFAAVGIVLAAMKLFFD
jgi:hypothetical protein